MNEALLWPILISVVSGTADTWTKNTQETVKQLATRWPEWRNGDPRAANQLLFEIEQRGG